jgi:KDO2-lipid IV(A) lauroyltransferase
MALRIYRFGYRGAHYNNNLTWSTVGKTIFPLFFKLASKLSLRALHRFGTVLGWATYLLSGRYAERLHDNLQAALPDLDEHSFRRVLRGNVAEMGKSLAELPWVWLRPQQEVVAGVRDCQDWPLVEEAQAQGRGVIILTPHLGCFEIAAQYIAARIPLTVLYRPPRLAWLEPMMRRGRERGLVELARTDVSGVRTMLKALKRGRAIGLLPDQAPGNGEGEWVNFFGRPAYTMTLVERLAGSTGAVIVMTYALRLPHGAGYELRFIPLTPAPGESTTQAMNRAVEDAVRVCPEQYLWSYNRYKVPAGAEPPVADGAA